MTARWFSGLATRLVLLEEERTAAHAGRLASFGLSRREAEVLARVADGTTNAEIAASLGMRPRTVGSTSRACTGSSVWRRGRQRPRRSGDRYGCAGAVTAGRRARQSGTVTSTTAATMARVAGIPAASLTRPYTDGASAEAPTASV